MSTNPLLIVIAGPTASGKTKLAVELARKFNLEIISADSRQVYAGLDIGTGKDRAEYVTGGAPVPVHMLDVASPDSVYTLFHFQRDCYQVLEKIFSKQRACLMVGGTGLYIEAVVKKYAIANVPEDVAFREQFMKMEKENLIGLLRSQFPVLAETTDLTSKKRVVRSLEIGRYSEKHSVSITPPPNIKWTPVVFCLKPDKKLSDQKIHTRLIDRLEQGMVEEVEALRVNLSDERLIQMGMEYKHITRYLQNETSREEMTFNLEQDIRGLAKQQRTYFRGFEKRGLPVTWVHSGEEGLVETHLTSVFSDDP